MMFTKFGFKIMTRSRRLISDNRIDSVDNK